MPLQFLVAALVLFVTSLSPQPGPPVPERAAERITMVHEQIAARGVTDERVLDALRTVPRHWFVSPEEIDHAYEDRPLGIGYGQTISQPYIVGFMTEALKLERHHRVLEIGTGSGYQAAVLSVLVKQVFTIEIIPDLARDAAARLKTRGFTNIAARVGDGYLGWPERAPYDRIIVTAAPDHIPKPLVDQLAVGGRMVIPVGPPGQMQELLIVSKTATGVSQERTIAVIFVPLTRKR